MGIIFLKIAGLGLFVTIVLLAITLIKRKTASIHKIWELAMRGDKLAIAYTVISINSFLLAAAAFVMIKLGV